MKAKELRIGNLVAINNEKHHPEMKGIPLVVCGIEKLRDDEGAKILLKHLDDKDNFVIPAFSQFENFIDPILLTEEWLLKFGFEHKGKKVFRTVNSSMDMSFPVAFTGVGYTSCQFSARRIDYIHQLQNLYFAITCEELAMS